MKFTFSKQVRQHLNLKNFIPAHFLTSLANDSTRFRVFDPSTTLYCFIYQVLACCSCKGVLTNLNIQRQSLGFKLISMNTSAYTQAKKRLCEFKLRDLAFYTGSQSDKNSEIWKWKGRNVELIDGTIINLEDTEKNQKEYPVAIVKGRTQGLPKLRMLGRFSHSSGALIDAEIGTYIGKNQGEPNLIRKMLNRIKPQSILVLDRFFTSYFLQSLFLENDLDYVIRSRDKFAEKYLGKKKKDITIVLKKPSRSHGPDDYDSYSEKIDLRIIRSTIKRKGFRAATIYILTSMLDEEKSEIEKLYLARWGVEVDIRNLKTTLETNLLRSKTPEMARKELWVSVIAYNLIRSITVGTSNIFKDYCPRKRSFKTTTTVFLECVKNFGSNSYELMAMLLKNEILNSKYRREPRAIKKRNNRFPLLTVPRKEAIKQKWGYSRRRGQMGLSAAGAA